MPTIKNVKRRDPVSKFLRSLGKRLRRLREGADERRFLDDVNGIIHIGANSGQEASRYAQLGVPVVWVEPLPDVFQVLERRIASYPDQTAIQALLSNVDDEEVDFHVAGESSSMFAFADHKKLWPSIDTTGSIRLLTSRLDSLMDRYALASPPFDALVIDTQGAEFLVLQGAGDRLKDIRRIVAEAADFEAYKGATNVNELVRFLGGHGYHLRHSAPMVSSAEVGTYYNLYFSK